MAPRVTITIDNQGNVQSDFSGFDDNSCQQHEQRLRSLLQTYGISTIYHVQKKSPQQISLESAGEHSLIKSSEVRIWNRTKI